MTADDDRHAPDSGTTAADERFRQDLARRLHDLAEHETGWADPTIAATGRAPVPDRLPLGAPPARAPWRRWPAVAAAGVLAGVVAGVTVAVVAGRSGGGLPRAAGDRSAAPAPATATATPTGPATGTTPGGGVAVPGGPGGPAHASGAPPATAGADGCPALPVASGPLADVSRLVASPVGTVAAGSRTPLTVALRFTAEGPTMEARVPVAYLTRAGQVVGADTGAQPFVVRAVPVVPGTTDVTVTLAATDCTGGPLAAGRYDVVVVYPYTVGSDIAVTSGSLVSAPVTVTVG